MKARDWVLLFVTAAAFTAVCGAYLGWIWPNGPGGIVTFVLSTTFAFALLRGNLRWSDG